MTDKEKPAFDCSLEQVVIGSCLRDNVLIDIARSEISEDAFYDPLHQRIFGAMLERRSEGLLTPRTLYAFIHDDPGMDDVGGLSYLENMRVVGSELAPIRQYAAILREFALKRYALQDMEDAIWSLKHTARPVAKVIAPLVVIADRAAQAETRARPQAADQIGRRVIEQAERAHQGERVPSVTTGSKKFDDAIGAMQAGDLIIIPGRSGMGKEQPVDTPVLTPSGWSTMGALKPGDFVVGADGRPTEVLAVWPQGIKQAYSVRFRDGTSVECGAEHLWTVIDTAGRRRNKPYAVPLKYMLARGALCKHGGHVKNKAKWKIPVTKPVQFSAANLPIDPYVLGVLIGDGATSGADLRYSNPDMDSDIRQFVKDRLPPDVSVHENRSGACPYFSFRGEGARRIKAALKSMGLAVKSRYKFLPDCLLFASEQQRMDLLRGLMDTDGSCLSNRTHFYTTSERLADGVVHLVRSLGGIAIPYRYGKAHLEKPDEWHVNVKMDVCPFYTARKVAHWKPTPPAKAIFGFGPTRMVEQVCITVAAADGLYLTKDFIVTHNTALLCGMSYAAAAAQHPTLVFSLEMMGPQWVERILSDIDYDDAVLPFGYGQFRRGSMTAEQLDRAARAATALTGLPLEIVDAGDVTVEDIGARARAFKAKHPGKLGLIVVDYLQRIQPSGQRDRSREQEVAHMSRSLKNLAKSLEWPVVAAAQLLTKGGDPRTANREQIPTLAAIRECVAGGTRVVAADSGKPIRVDELKGGDRILGLSNEDKIVAASVSAIWKTGVKTVFKITTRSGRMLRATANHPVLTARGYIEVSALRDDDVVVSPFRLPPCTFEKPERADLCRLLGYMIGDGTMQKGKTPGLIAPDSAVFEDACSIIRTNFPLVDIKLKSNGFNDAWFPQGGGTRKQYGNQLTEWLRLIGILGTRDYTKFVPEFVFEAGKSGARNFLAGYLASDGCVKKDRINFDTTSYKLALDVQHLLCLVGIPSTIGRGSRSLMATRDIYRIQVASEFRVKFCEEIKTVGARGTKLRQLLNGLASRPPLTRNSLMNLPRSATEDAAWAAGFKNQGKRLSRRHCLKLATDTGDPVLHIWANSDVIWDGIRSIENVGEEMVYDLEVPETGNFIADGICVHNSGQIEMDADIIMAPHRKAWFLRKEKPFDSPDDSPEMVQWRGEYRACKNILHGYGLKMRHGGEFDLDLWCDMRSSVVRDEEPRIPLSAEDRNARDLLEGI